MMLLPVLGCRVDEMDCLGGGGLGRSEQKHCRTFQIYHTWIRLKSLT
jgi:hypothetical protein